MLDEVLVPGGIVVGPVRDAFSHPTPVMCSRRQNPRVWETLTNMAIATVNPTTGEVVKTFKPLSDAALEEKVQRAAETFLTYRKTSFAERARKMTRAAEILESEKDECGRLM